MISLEPGTTLALVLGGGTGAVLRYACGLALRRQNGFAWATFVVNVLGSACLGFFLELSSALPPGFVWRALLTDGLLGALTTFSTFAFETFTLALHGDWGKALLNLLANTVFGLLAVAAGFVLAGGLT